jgi:hypothetical protein
LWAPAQLVTLLLVSYMIFKVWRSVARDAGGDENA